MAKNKENTALHNDVDQLLLHLIKIMNAVVMTVPFAVAWYTFYASRIVSPFYNKGNWLIVFLYCVLYIIFCKTYDAFLVSYNRISEIVYSQMLSAGISISIMYIVLWLLQKHLPAILPLLLSLAAQFFISFIWAWLSRKWYFRTFPAKKTAVIWDQVQGLNEIIKSYELDSKFDVVMNITAKECLDNLDSIHDMQAVFLSGVHSQDRNEIIKYCIENRISAFIIPRIGDVLMSGAHRIHIFHLPILRLERYSPSPEYLFCKRLFDVFASALALIILSPLMLVVALLIKKDGGPAFYKQRRLTKDGKEFDVIKFRSMRVDAEKDGVARLSTGDNDDRITPIGKIIRKVRIDELPQLINIIKGDMSIVGPRPERPEIAEQYEKELPEFRLRLQAKCGLTGYAQVYGKYNTTPYDKLQMDLMYISNPSLTKDLSIIFATIKILFMPESTEGIEEGKTTASRDS